MLFNSFKNITLVSAEENSNTLIPKQNNITIQLNIAYGIIAKNI